MPVVFATSPVNQREQNYADVLDEQYEFPRQYAKRVVEGDVFVYYRSTKAGGPAGYFGCGVVGPVSPSSEDGRLVCRVLSVRFFDGIVTLRDPSSEEYIENVGPNRVFLQQGVRTISDDALARILALAGSAGTETEAGSSPTPDEPAFWARGHRGVYSKNIEQQQATVRYSLDTVINDLKDEFPDATVDEQPHNNPGFDILLKGAGISYVEVKGTVGSEPGFFLSEGERAFSIAHANKYRLYVVYAINLTAGTHAVFRSDGAIESTRFQLEPRQYRVQVLRPRD